MTAARSQDSERPPLALTTLLSIRVRGLATNRNGGTVTLDIPRQDPVEPPHIYQTIPPGSNSKYEKTLPQLHPPSRSLPDDLRATLDLRVGDMISSNARHAVYDVDITKVDPPGAFYIPPLVIKVAVDSLLLAEEAGLYGHIEELQGVIAPRCYGYFRGDNQKHMHYLVPPSDDFDPDEPPQLHAYTTLDILLLEKVGGHLPIYRPDQLPPEVPPLWQELVDMFHDLAKLNVWYGNDCSLENLAYAPACPPGLPGLPSPYRNRVYSLRLIDFEESKVMNLQPHYLQAIGDNYARLLFLQIAGDLR